LVDPPQSRICPADLPTCRGYVDETEITRAESDLDSYRGVCGKERREEFKICVHLDMFRNDYERIDDCALQLDEDSCHDDRPHCEWKVPPLLWSDDCGCTEEADLMISTQSDTTFYVCDQLCMADPECFHFMTTTQGDTGLEDTGECTLFRFGCTNSEAGNQCYYASDFEYHSVEFGECTHLMQFSRDPLEVWRCKGVDKLDCADTDNTPGLKFADSCGGANSGTMVDLGAFEYIFDCQKACRALGEDCNEM
jgi:hypothetical protein